MSLLRKLNIKASSQNNTGFGTSSSDYGGRFFNKDGKANVEKRGVSILERISWYHTMLEMPGWKFISLTVIFYIAVNVFFAGIYFWAGVDKLNGVSGGTAAEQFGEAFFFSAQTLTTVGYGHVSPSGILMSSIAALEALTGLLTLAIITSLLYGRFSRPTAYLKFSENALIAPYKDGTALMFRTAPYKNTTLTDAEVRVNVGIVMEENGKTVNKFFRLPLEFDTVNTLTLNWTVVHPINEESPFYGLSQDDLNMIDGEIMVFIKAFDDMFSNTVVARTSYVFTEVVYGAKFVPMFHQNKNDSKTIMELSKLNDFETVSL